MIRSLFLLLPIPTLASAQTASDRLDRLESFLRQPIRRMSPLPLLDDPWDTLIGPSIRGMFTYSPMHHKHLPLDLQQSGGTRGIFGWYSQMFMSDHVRGDDGQWPEGTIFVDVLRNEDGIVWEHREAHRMDYGWDRFVVYRNERAMPKGYVKIKRSQCSSCHNSGPFDTIFSMK